MALNNVIGVRRTDSKYISPSRVFLKNARLGGFLSAFFSCTFFLCAFASVHAQQSSVTIRIILGVPAKALIEGSTAPSRDWSFRNDYAGALELGRRIESFRVFDSAGNEIPNRKIAPGQFEASLPATKFRYEIDLTPPAHAVDGARVSWISSERGVLMLADLLPVRSDTQRSTTAAGEKLVSSLRAQNHLRIRLNLPDGWAAYSNENQDASGFEIMDADDSVFVIGNHFRTSQATLSGLKLTLVISGNWAFTDEEVMKMTSDVLKTHRSVFDSMPSSRAMLTLIPFPSNSTFEKWSAETRGASVTLLLANQPSKAAALSQLSVPLAHELFHLWVPNDLALAGDYDWFYEGFTVYQAARAAVRLDFLSFQDFLNAIARAYDRYRSNVNRDQWSLIDASQRRWTNGESAVYQKGMLVAFLYDLNLRTQSRGKRSLEDVYRELFRKYRLADTPTARSQDDGNDAVIAALSREPGMREFVETRILRASEINLAEGLSDSGLLVENFGPRTRISVNGKLTRKQRDLLRDLGYNDLVRSRPKQ